MNQQPILLWKHQNLTNAFTLRVGDIRYIGLIRTDRKGESYWKFKEFIQKDDSNPGFLEASLDKLIQENDKSINKSESNN